jgi:F0F1-type ATP synthase membrane subunit b/b'
MNVVGSDYQLYLQSLGGFLIILVIFVPFLKWAFTSPSAKAEKRRKRKLKEDLKRLKTK